MAEIPKEEIDKLRREADGAVYRSDKMFRDNLDKLSESNRAQIEAAAQRVKDALKGNDSALIKSTSERLNQVWHVAFVDLYRASSQKSQSGSAGASHRGSSAAQNEMDIVDVEGLDPHARLPFP